VNRRSKKRRKTNKTEAILAWGVVKAILLPSSACKNKDVCFSGFNNRFAIVEGTGCGSPKGKCFGFLFAQLTSLGN